MGTGSKRRYVDFAARAKKGLRYEGFKLFHARSIVHGVLLSRSKTPTDPIPQFLIAPNTQIGQVEARGASAGLAAGGIALRTGEMAAGVKDPLEFGTEESLSADDAAFHYISHCLYSPADT